MGAEEPTGKACRAASRLGQMVRHALAEGVLNPPGYRLLAYLSTGSSAATVLADKLAVSRPTVTATTDWLESRGLVARSANLLDRRRVTIAITPRGEAALADADARVARRLAEVLEPLGEDEARGIVAALETLHDALNEDRERRHGSLAPPEPAG